MSLTSIDALQRTLADTVFQYASDRKKAAGRALGTLVEVVTFYALRTWRLTDHIVIERRIPEFANTGISHNVEFSLHPVTRRHTVQVEAPFLPLSAAKVVRHLPSLRGRAPRSVQVLSRDAVKRNSTVLIADDAGPTVANVHSLTATHCGVVVCELSPEPFAIFECKRVGVEEGMRKGPQTIEKAKQGAYVAGHVSSLQRVRRRDGSLHGILEQEDGSFRTGPYLDVLRDIVDGSLSSLYPGFILTVGVVSNHGNWFTSDNLNKELRVLAQSYDWLLFLTDHGLVQFIQKCILEPERDLHAIRDAFLSSYSGKRGANRFTKVRMDVEADRALDRFFSGLGTGSDNWFTVISPTGGSLDMLRMDLHTLAGKSPRRGSARK